MTRNHNRTSVDANQGEIIDTFRRMGASVLFIQEPVDLLVGFNGCAALVEIKRDHRQIAKGETIGNYRFTDTEREFYRKWNGVIPVVVIETGFQAGVLFEAMNHGPRDHVLAVCHEITEKWAAGVRERLFMQQKELIKP